MESQPCRVDDEACEGESSLHDPFGLVGSTVAGRYRILSVLAKGGMGRIYRAEQLPLGRPVALKVLHVEMEELGDQDLSARFQQRFLLEAASVAKLRHPNIVVVYDYGRIESAVRGTYFMAMEFVDGVTLSRLLRQEGGTLSVRTAFFIAKEIARALREAHRRGMIHRDLKPSNVMISENAEGMHVKVLDFGLVKLSHDENQELTKEGHFVGSPKYMAPEQIKSSHTDGRADIYALGVLLYHMIAGKVPFSGPAAMNTLVAHLNDPVPPLPSRPDITTAVERLIKTCLEKEPVNRFATVEDFIAALDQAMQQDRSWRALSPTDSFQIPRLSAVPADVLRKPGYQLPSKAVLAVLAVASVAGGALAWLYPGASEPAAAAASRQEPEAAAAGPNENALPSAASARDDGAPQVRATTPERFTLFVSSTPSGATVIQDGAPIGATPTFVKLDYAETESAPARIEVRHPGYAHHVFSQGPSREDVYVTAQLVRLPAPAAPSPVPRRRRPRRAAPEREAAPPSPAAEMSIKTRR